MKKLVLILSVLFSGCYSWDGSPSVPAEFNDYVRMLHEEARVRNLDVNVWGHITIEYADNINCNGVYPARGCAYEDGTILIDREFASWATDTQIEIFIFHEIGHAYFKKHHVQDSLNIMWGNMVDNPYLYKENRTKILDNYFGL